MATTKEIVESHELQVEDVNLPRLLQRSSDPNLTPSETTQLYGSVGIRVYHAGFKEMLGDNPTFSRLASSDRFSKNPFFHMGCAYIQDKKELYLTSDLLQSSSSSRLPVILISKVKIQHPTQNPAGDSLPENHLSIEWQKLRPPPDIAMPSGAIAFDNGVLYCAQGSLAQPGGLFHMPFGKRPKAILTNYFGTPFNSIQSVVEDGEGALWFTDSSVGYENEFRPKPSLPNQVYYFLPRSMELRVMATGFARPSGIATNGAVLYVGDLGSGQTASSLNPSSPSAIYAFDKGSYDEHNRVSPFLTNKRVFAFPTSGLKGGLALDENGNVYAACGGGVEVWSSRGVLLAIIQIPGGCRSLAFGCDGELFICSDQSLWRFQLEPTSPRHHDDGGYNINIQV